MRLLRALRAIRPAEGGASRILLGAAADGERFELRKQALLRGSWGANSQHGLVAIYSGFELNAAFDAEVVNLLLHGYEVDGALDADELAVLAEEGMAIGQPSGEIALPTWLPQQWRSLSTTAAAARALAGKLVVRESPPEGVRQLLQLPGGGGLPRLINPGSIRSPWGVLPPRWRRDWVAVIKRLATTRAPGAPHLLCDVVLPTNGRPMVALDLLAYDWRDVRPMDAAQRLSLLDQGITELGPPTSEIIALPRLSSRLRMATGHVSLIEPRSPYHSALLVGGEAGTTR